MKAEQLRQYVVVPVLTYLGLYSESAETLLMLTAAQESHLGDYIHQTGKGPACGIFQMEPVTHDSLWSTTLERNTDLAERIKMIAGKWSGFSKPDAEEMIGNMNYACAMARVKYLSIPVSIPNTLQGIAAYYKQYYNTPLGAATVEQALENYHRYVA